MVTGSTSISLLPTGTIDSLTAVIPLSIGMPSSPETIRASLAQLAAVLGTVGFIQENSAQLTYITGTSYQVEAGSAIVNGSLLTWTSPIVRSGLTLTSGTVQYAYLYSSAGTPAMEESTTAPVWDTTLDYYKKTGDSTRRCIGFLMIPNANTIQKFVNLVQTRTSEFLFVDEAATGRTPINNALSTGTWTSFSMSTIIPSNAIEVGFIAKLILATAGDQGTLGLSPISLGTAAANASAPYQVRGRAEASGANIFFGNTWMSIVVPQTYFYRTLPQAGSPLVQIVVTGARIIR